MGLSKFHHPSIQLCLFLPLSKEKGDASARVFMLLWSIQGRRSWIVLLDPTDADFQPMKWVEARSYIISSCICNVNWTQSSDNKYVSRTLARLVFQMLMPSEKLLMTLPSKSQLLQELPHVESNTRSTLHKGCSTNNEDTTSQIRRKAVMLHFLCQKGAPSKSILKPTATTYISEKNMLQSYSKKIQQTVPANQFSKLGPNLVDLQQIS